LRGLAVTFITFGTLTLTVNCSIQETALIWTLGGGSGQTEISQHMALFDK
jgi:hypothetical protein